MGSHLKNLALLDIFNSSYQRIKQADPTCYLLQAYRNNHGILLEEALKAVTMLRRRRIFLEGGASGAGSIGDATWVLYRLVQLKHKCPGTSFTSWTDDSYLLLLVISIKLVPKNLVKRRWMSLIQLTKRKDIEAKNLSSARNQVAIPQFLDASNK